MELCFPFQESTNRITILRQHRYNVHTAGLLRSPVYRWLDKAGIRVRFKTVQSLFLPLERPHRLWGPPSLLFSGYFGGGGPPRLKKFTIHLQMVPRLRMWKLYFTSHISLSALPVR